MNDPREGLFAPRQARFLAAMGHELRTPLNIIIGFAEILARGQAGTPAQQADFASEILTGAQQQLQLINDVVDLARADAGLLELAVAPGDARELAAEALRRVQADAASRGVEVTSHLDGAPGRVELDAIRVTQVLQACLAAAVRLAGAGRRVNLRVGLESAARWRFEVAGAELEPDDLAQLFEPAPGPRLGMALARRIVEAHGGEIGAVYSAGRTCVIRGVLPCEVRER